MSLWVYLDLKNTSSDGQRVWLMAVLSSLTWPESVWLDSGVGCGCTPVAHWVIKVRWLKQPSSHTNTQEIPNMAKYNQVVRHSEPGSSILGLSQNQACHGGQVRTGIFGSSDFASTTRENDIPRTGERRMLVVVKCILGCSAVPSWPNLPMHTKTVGAKDDFQAFGVYLARCSLFEWNSTCAATGKLCFKSPQEHKPRQERWSGTAQAKPHLGQPRGTQWSYHPVFWFWRSLVKPLMWNVVAISVACSSWHS